MIYAFFSVSLSDSISLSRLAVSPGQASNGTVCCKVCSFEARPDITEPRKALKSLVQNWNGKGQRAKAADDLGFSLREFRDFTKFFASSDSIRILVL